MNEKRKEIRINQELRLILDLLIHNMEIIGDNTKLISNYPQSEWIKAPQFDLVQKESKHIKNHLPID